MKAAAQRKDSVSGPGTLFEGGGEMGALMQAYDWAQHPLGPPEQWPKSLQTGIRLILRSAFPMFIWWSDQFYMFHNDPYLPALGKKHPRALGSSARVTWAEIWEQLGTVAEEIMHSGSHFYAEDLLVPLDRKGFLEETYWTFSYSAMPDDEGAVGGIFCACSEVTGHVLGQRRLRTIKDVVDAAFQLLTVEQATQQASELMAQNPADVPFNLIFLLDREGAHAQLAGKSLAMPAGTAPQQPALAGAAEEAASWPFEQVRQSLQTEVVELDAALQRALPGGPGTTARAAVLPIFKPGSNELYGFLVAGISHMLEYDAEYQDFHRFLASQVAVTIESVRSRLQLQKREESLRQMADSIPHLVITTRPDGFADYANERWYAYTGLTEEQTLGSSWTQALHPDDREEAQRNWQEALQTGQDPAIEYRLRRADGSYRWHRAHVISGRDEQQSITRWYGTFTDIHDQKLAEDSLKRSREHEKLARTEAERQQERLYSILMQAPACFVLLKGPDHVFELVNPLYQQLFGTRPLIGKPILEALPELAGQFFITALNTVYRTGETISGLATPAYLDRTGSGQLELCFFDFVYQATLDLDGSINGILVFAYEVTDQVRARKAIEESAERERLLLNSIPHLTWTSLPDRSTSFYNRQWSIYTGLPAEELHRHDWQHLLHPEDASYTQHRIAATLAKGQPLEVESRFRRHDGSYRWHLTQVVPLLDEQGQIMLYVGTATDIHERKLSEERLQALTEELAIAYADIQERHNELAVTNLQLTRINSDLDNFVYTASHDLRSPINSMEGLLQVLEEQLQDRLQEEEQEVMAHLSTSMAKLNQTIRDLADFVKVQKDSNLPPEAVALREVLADVQADFTPLINELQASISWELEVESISYPKKHVRTIMYNLLSNALKYHDPERKPEIKVSTRQAKDAVVLTVSDNGLGLHPAQQKKLFGMFQRMHPDIEGSGIGLYTIKRIIENYGGQIRVESKEGQGTSFHVHFLTAL